jgi:hypothetical protein
VFTEDAVWDGTLVGLKRPDSLAAIRKYFSEEPNLHPLAHHATNGVVREDGHGTVRVLSKGLMILRDGTVGGCTYRDVATRTRDGWRLSERTVDAPVRGPSSD